MIELPHTVFIIALPWIFQIWCIYFAFYYLELQYMIGLRLALEQFLEVFKTSAFVCFSSVSALKFLGNLQLDIFHRWSAVFYFSVLWSRILYGTFDALCLTITVKNILFHANVMYYSPLLLFSLYPLYSAIRKCTKK